MLTEHQVNITDFMYMRSTRFYLARTRDIDIRLKCGASILCSHKIIRNIRAGVLKREAHRDKYPHHVAQPACAFHSTNELCYETSVINNRNCAPEHFGNAT